MSNAGVIGSAHFESLMSRIAEGMADGRRLRAADDDDKWYRIGHDGGVLLRIALDTEETSQ